MSGPAVLLLKGNHNQLGLRESKQSTRPSPIGKNTKGQAHENFPGRLTSSSLVVLIGLCTFGVFRWRRNFCPAMSCHSGEKILGLIQNKTSSKQKREIQNSK